MSPHDLGASCIAVMTARREMGLPMEESMVTLVTPKGWKRPPKFPRGYLLTVNREEERVWHFNAMRVLAWLSANKLVNVVLVTENPKCT